MYGNDEVATISLQRGNLTTSAACHDFSHMAFGCLFSLSPIVSLQPPYRAT